MEMKVLWSGLHRRLEGCPWAVVWLQTLLVDCIQPTARTGTPEGRVPREGTGALGWGRLGTWGDREQQARQAAARGVTPCPKDVLSGDSQARGCTCVQSCWNRRKVCFWGGIGA